MRLLPASHDVVISKFFIDRPVLANVLAIVIVLIVNGENVVEQRKVTIGQLDDGLRVIESGIKPDDRVVIAGLLRVIPSQKVDPQLQKIGTSQASAK